MRVSHVVTGTDIGGAQIMLQRYLEALGPRAADHEVISLLPDGEVADPIRAAGSAVTSLGFRLGRPSPTGALRLRAHLRRSAPDVVHGWMYHGCLAASIGLAGRSRPGRPGLVWGIHHSLEDIGAESRSTQMTIRAMTRVSPSVDAISYCSDVSRRQHEAAGFAAGPAALIPNAVDTARFRPDPDGPSRLRSLLGIEDDRVLIGNVARSHPMKDHVSMVRAMARLIEDGHDVHGVIVGAGHDGSAAETEAKALGLSGRIDMLPNRDDIHCLLPGFDLFLLSSAWGEAFPLAVCEAMACEVPCVVTDVGDCATLVGSTGISVPPGDPAAQAAALAGLLAEGRAACVERGRAARSRVSRLYSTERYVDAHAQLYSGAAAGPSSDAGRRSSSRCAKMRRSVHKSMKIEGSSPP